MSRKFGIRFLPILLAAGVLHPDDLHAQNGADRLTVWSGVYTEEQAGRGEARFNESCTGCHGGGGSNAPTLSTGEDAFLEDWGEDYLVSLFDRLRGTMPARAPGSLSDQSYLDLVGFMLDMNGFPAGLAELTLDMLPNVRVEGRNGPGPVPDFSLVEVVGCLESGAEGWLLNEATELARTRDPASSTEAELGLLDLRAPGTDTYELIYMYPSPGPFVGHKVEVKGFLIREAEPDQINVSSFASISDSCGT
jgi:cytochrome c5